MRNDGGPSTLHNTLPLTRDRERAVYSRFWAFLRGFVQKQGKGVRGGEERGKRRRRFSCKNCSKKSFLAIFSHNLRK
jgi:hypothetical protein